MILDWLSFGVALVGVSVQVTLAALLWPWFKERRAEGKEKTTKRIVNEHQVRKLLEGTDAAALLDQTSPQTPRSSHPQRRALGELRGRTRPKPRTQSPPKKRRSKEDELPS